MAVDRERMAEFEDALRKVIDDFDDDVAMVLDGVLMIEVVEKDELKPMLKIMEIGNVAPWVQLGMGTLLVKQTEDELFGVYED